MIEELPSVILALAISVALIRLIRGPNLESRVIALDLMNTIGIGLIAIHAVRTDQPIFLDIAVVLASVSFLGTVAFAYYLEQPKDDTNNH